MAAVAEDIARRREFFEAAIQRVREEARAHANIDPRLIVRIDELRAKVAEGRKEVEELTKTLEEKKKLIAKKEAGVKERRRPQNATHPKPSHAAEYVNDFRDRAVSSIKQRGLDGSSK